MNNDTIASQARSESFRAYLKDTLMETLAIDTTPRADVADLGRAEEAVFAILERELKKLELNGAKIERRPINSAIAQHEFFSLPYYTKSDAKPEGLDVHQTYRGRHNLVFSAGSDKPGLALNAHVDVVQPYVPPRVEGDVIFGRGSCDDKGCVVTILGALRLLNDYLRATGKTLPRNLVAMFVIEEEMGGNGSLSLALDSELRRRYDEIMVLECTGNRLHPGNRGAVWYKVEARLPGVNLFEASAYIIEEMEREGRAIRSESAHPLFPHRPVQTCHGIIGHSGQHPSRINGRVDFDIVFNRTPSADIRGLISDILEDALAQYIGIYGDKTKVIDPTTGKPKVDHHYDLLETPTGFTVQVHGSTGHMGSIFVNDGAITKMAAMVRSLVTSRPALEARAGGTVTLHLHDWTDQSHLLMEGGQGFLPTHPMRQVQERMRLAVWRGAERYLHIAGWPANVQSAFAVTYDKLHNAAFAGSADSPSVRDGLAALAAAGISGSEPVRGWDVSCDARIFACTDPNLSVLTFGPGQLMYAHADNEQLDIREAAQAAEALAYYVLRRFGLE